jgi:membrane protease YdiL (CAAX protease family)
MAQVTRVSTISILDAVVVSTICFGMAIVFSIQAVLAGFPTAKFSESGNTWMIGLEVVLSATALIYLYMRGFDISSLYPSPTIVGSFAGLGLFFLAWIVGLVVVTPFVSGQKPQVVEFSFTGISLLSTIMFAMVNGTFEEIFLLGVLVRGLRGLGLSLAIGIPLLVRILYHLYQGPAGVIWILAFGLTFSFSYVRSQQLWPPVLAHILWDIVPVIISGS